MDYGSIVSSVDLSSVVTTIVSIAALWVAVEVARYGSRLILDMIGDRDDPYADGYYQGNAATGMWDEYDRDGKLLAAGGGGSLSVADGYDEAAWDSAEEDYLYGSGSGNNNPEGQRG